MPERGEDFVDAKVLAQIEAIGRKADWSNDDTQAALVEHVENMRAITTGFLDETKADKDYGGTNFAETQKLANAAIDRIRPKDHPRRDSFMKFMARFGGNNHIESVSFLADIGRLMAEDAPGVGTSLRGAPKTAEETFYGSGGRAQGS